MRKRTSLFVKKRKKIYRSSFFWYLIFFFLLFYFFYLFVFAGSLFLTKNFQVETKDPFLAKRIFLFLKPGNLLLLNSKELKKEIEDRFLEIKNVVLKKKYPDTLKLEIEEREEIFEFCSQACFVSDDQGFLFSQKAKKEIPKIFVREDLYLKKTILSKNEILNISQIIEYLKKKEMFFDKIKIENKNLIFENSQGFSFLFDLQKDPQWQIKKLFSFLEKTEPEKLRRIKTIDLRFGNFVNFEYY
jgi:hypothetical protein